MESEQNGRDEIEIGAYPVPFGESLSITIRGIVKAGATLQLLNHVGRPVRVVSLPVASWTLRFASATSTTCAPDSTPSACINGDTVVSKRILKG